RGLDPNVTWGVAVIVATVVMPYHDVRTGGEDSQHVDRVVVLARGRDDVAVVVAVQVAGAGLILVSEVARDARAPLGDDGELGEGRDRRASGRRVVRAGPAGAP